jgi:hypothetical protein
VFDDHNRQVGQSLSNSLLEQCRNKSMVFVISRVDLSSSLSINMCTLKHNIIAIWGARPLGGGISTSDQRTENEGGRVFACVGFDFEELHSIEKLVDDSNAMS